MFGLGPTELMVILVLVLVLLGPKKLPEVASGLGKAIRQFRKATGDLTSQLDIDEEVKQPFRELKAAIRDEPAPYVAPVAAVAAVAPPAHTVAVAPAPAAPVVPTASAPIAPNEPTPDLLVVREIKLPEAKSSESRDEKPIALADSAPKTPTAKVS